MALRTVRLDGETEEVLRQIRKVTGLPISEALKEGLRAFHEKLRSRTVKTPYEIYKTLDLGEGGWAIDDSAHVSRGVTRALKKKLHR